MSIARTLGVLGMLSVLGVLVFMYVSSRHSLQPQLVIEISYTDTGYDPREVRIRKGEGVRWVNRSSHDMWPASAVHPTHALYPEKNDTDCLGSSFDACRALPPGEEYEFIFEHVGTWKFHDHIRASHTGSVTVVE